MHPRELNSGRNWAMSAFDPSSHPPPWTNTMRGPEFRVSGKKTSRDCEGLEPYWKLLMIGPALARRQPPAARNGSASAARLEKRANINRRRFGNPDHMLR